MMPLLQMCRITKKIEDAVLLNHVDFCAHAGEIHVLLGENGAGKSTLMHILAGMPQMTETGGYEGAILMEGRPVQISSPKDAAKLGIAVVHQELSVLDEFMVWENLFLNKELTKHGVLDKKEMIKRSAALLSQMGGFANPSDHTATLCASSKHLLETARAINTPGLRLLLFDEPTASLPEAQKNTVLAEMRRLKNKGLAIVFITHSIKEAVQIADRLTILKRGHVDCSLTGNEITQQTILDRLFPDLCVLSKKLPPANTKPILEISDFCAGHGPSVLSNIYLQIFQGEIVGILGDAKNSTALLAQGCMGLLACKGTFLVDATPLSPLTPAAAYQSGIAFVPGDRNAQGLYLGGTIEDNIGLTAMQSQNKFLKKIGPFYFKDTRALRKYSQRAVEDLSIQCTSTQQRVQELSGGNRQKLCLAKALALSPRLLIVCDMAKGVDMASLKTAQEKILWHNQNRNMAVLIFSSQWEELKAICHRILLLQNGALKERSLDDAPFLP